MGSRILAYIGLNMLIRNCGRIVVRNALKYRNNQTFYMSLSSALPKSALSSISNSGSSTKNESTSDGSVIKKYDEKKMTYREKMKNYWNKYGLFFVATYLSVYATTLTGLFLALDNGILSAAAIGMDTKEIIHGVCKYICTYMHLFYILFYKYSHLSI